MNCQNINTKNKISYRGISSTVEGFVYQSGQNGSFNHTVVIGRTVSLISSVGRAPDLQAGGHRFVLHRAHFFLFIVYLNGAQCQ